MQKLTPGFKNRVLLKLPTTDPPTADPPTHRPLTTYPPTHRPLTHQFTLKQRPDPKHLLHSASLENFNDLSFS